MNRLVSAFEERRAVGRKSLLPYLTAGYPDIETTIDILRQVEPAGPCACVELGIPFSDPIADGPVIQASFSRALESGFAVTDLFERLRAMRGEIGIPLIAMVSYSIVYRRGAQHFCEVARGAGIDGLIVPDLALEEAGDLARIAASAELALTLIAAPTSTPPRIARIAHWSTPFVYYQSVAGVTGERRGLPADLVEKVSRLRAASGKPVCVGFGISTPQHVTAVCSVADGAIVGSAIIKRMAAAAGRGEGRSAVVRAAIDVMAELGAGVPSPDPPARKPGP